MPRNRKRTTQKAAWTTENVDITVKSFREDVKSIHRTAKESGIPYSAHPKRLKQGLVSAPKMGRKPVISDGKEQILIDHFVRLSNM
jgi:hypothetical protein